MATKRTCSSKLAGSSKRVQLDGFRCELCDRWHEGSSCPLIRVPDARCSCGHGKFGDTCFEYITGSLIYIGGDPCPCSLATGECEWCDDCKEAHPDTECGETRDLGGTGSGRDVGRLTR